MITTYEIVYSLSLCFDSIKKFYLWPKSFRKLHNFQQSTHQRAVHTQSKCHMTPHLGIGSMCPLVWLYVYSLRSTPQNTPKGRKGSLVCVYDSINMNNKQDKSP